MSATWGNWERGHLKDHKQVLVLPSQRLRRLKQDCNLPRLRRETLVSKMEGMERKGTCGEEEERKGRERRGG